MKWLLTGLCVLAILGCTSRKPTARPLISVSYEQADRIHLTESLASIIEANGIKIASSDIRNGKIVTDSFDVLPEYCDCGKNFFGVEYPGTRHGVMKISVTGSNQTSITFDFKTRLLITVNHRELICTSYGVLEKKFLDELDKKLGLTPIRAND